MRLDDCIAEKSPNELGDSWFFPEIASRAGVDIKILGGRAPFG